MEILLFIPAIAFGGFVGWAIYTRLTRIQTPRGRVSDPTPAERYDAYQASVMRRIYRKIGR